jgi:hypothetical protein
VLALAGCLPRGVARFPPHPLDAQLGRIADATGPVVNVVSASDHGIRSSVPVLEGVSGRVLTEAIPEMLRRRWPRWRTAALGTRDVGDSRPILATLEESYLDQLRALR